MRFITRCPSCGTSFRVVVDQLKIADGWVRCGHCQQVFDATQDLQPEAPAPVAAAAQPAASDPGASERHEPQQEAASPAETAGGSVLPASSAPPEPNTPAGAVLPPSPSAPPVRPEPEVESACADAPDASGALGLRAQNDDAATPVLPEPAFVRAARRRARWRHPAVRAVLAFLVLALAVLLAAQLAWVGRAALLARWPQLEPLYATACAALGCAVGPRRDVGAVVVEGSVLLRRAPDRYSFHLVLRNRADAAVAAPALELTLVDEQQQPLVRRVWLPGEWPQPLDVLAAGSEWPLQFELAFDHPQASRMSGYQAVLFYP